MIDVTESVIRCRRRQVVDVGDVTTDWEVDGGRWLGFAVVRDDVFVPGLRRSQSSAKFSPAAD
jgi:hypothetical protein